MEDLTKPPFYLYSMQVTLPDEWLSDNNRHKGYHHHTHYLVPPLCVLSIILSLSSTIHRDRKPVTF